jgi:hypothetical protein
MMCEVIQPFLFGKNLSSSFKPMFTAHKEVGRVYTKHTHCVPIVYTLAEGMCVLRIYAPKKLR